MRATLARGGGLDGQCATGTECGGRGEAKGRLDGGTARLAVIRAGGEDVAEARVRPAHLPHGAFVARELSHLLALAALHHVEYLDGAVR